MIRLAKSFTRFGCSLVAGLLALALPLQAQDFAWARGIGGALEDLATDMTTDAAGNIYVTGYFGGTVDFDPGASVAYLAAADTGDVFVLKLDNSGSFVWARRMGGSLTDLANGVSVDSAGNVYTTGWFEGTADFDPGPGIATLTATGAPNPFSNNTSVSSNAFISKLDSNGNFLWAKALNGSGYSEGRGISVDAAGGVYTTGYFSGTADFDPSPGVANLITTGEFDAYVSKLDSSGNLVWARRMGGEGYVWAGGMALDVSGNVHVTGYCAGDADFDPGLGVANLTCAHSSDVFVLKLDSAGSFIWARRMGGDRTETGRGVTVDVGGNVYATGWFAGTVDFDPGPGVANLSPAGAAAAFVCKLDNGGNFLWAKALSGPGYAEGQRVKVDAAGNAYTAGLFFGPIDFDPGPGVASLTPAGNEDAFVSKLDSAGNFLWARRVGGPNDDWTHNLALDAVGNVYTAGVFAGTADFDPGDGIFNLTSAGDSDIFVLKLSGGPGGLPPVITSGGIVVANLLPVVNTVSPLSIISVFGENFSTETVLYPNLTNSGEIATTLGGACLMMNGEALPLFAVTPGQINAQVSANKTLGPASFSVVANCDAAAPLTSAFVSLTPPPQNLTSGVETATVEEATPAFFIFTPVASDGFIAARFNATESQPAVAVAPAGLFNDEYGPSRPAMPGDIILLYGTGWGETMAGLSAGQIASGAAELLPGASAKITLGGIQLAPENVLYIGATPGAAGLYQAAIRIPANAQPGNQQVALTVYGKSTPVGPVIPIALP